jgi:hypothetical protein
MKKFFFSKQNMEHVWMAMRMAERNNGITAMQRACILDEDGNRAPATSFMQFMEKITFVFIVPLHSIEPASI